LRLRRSGELVLIGSVVQLRAAPGLPLEPLLAHRVLQVAHVLGLKRLSCGPSAAPAGHSGTVPAIEMRSRLAIAAHLVHVTGGGNRPGGHGFSAAVVPHKGSPGPHET
jgi:hypothetical protein